MNGLDEKQRTVENNYIHQNWLNINYLERDFNIDLLDQPLKQYQRLGIPGIDGKKLVKISIREGDALEKGLLFGIFSTDGNGKTTFESHSISNRGIIRKSNGLSKTENHVPNLMREVVVQLISSGKIDKMVTSAVLSQGAIATYDRILADERIDAEKKYLGDDKSLPYYIFTKKAE